MTHLVYAASYLDALVRAVHVPVEINYLGSGQFLGRDNVAAQDVQALLARVPGTTLLVPDREDAATVCRGREVLLSVGLPGLRAYVRLLATRPWRPPWVAVIDEGLGSYGTWRTRRAAWSRQGGSEPWTTVRAAAVTAGDALLTRQRWSLYVERGGMWRVDEAVAAPLRALAADGPVRRGVAVFLSQPWVELGVLPSPVYEAHLGAVDDACASAGLRLEVRPHPAERQRAYGDVPVSEGRGPAELDPEVYRAEVVLGADSTALLNAAALHHVRAVRVRMPELDGLEQALASRQRALLSAFLPPPVRVEALADALGAGPPAEVG